MSETKTGKRPVARTALLVLLGLVSNLILIANPGYFSHDELYNLGTARGPWSGCLDAAFGRTLLWRPAGDMLQLTLLHFFGGTPQIIHLFSASLTVADGILFGRLLAALGAKERVSWCASVLFFVSPLTVFGSGWIGVLYDQIYVLLLLLALILIVERRPRARLGSAAATAGLVAFALLFKETAIIAPAAILLLAWWRCDWRPLTANFAAACVAVVAILGLQAGSLWHATSSSAYRLAPAFAPANAAVYSVFPFAVDATEVHQVFIVCSRLRWMLAAAAHLAVVAMLLLARRRLALLYLAAYALPLAPLLFSQSQSTQYLFASSLPLCAALAYLVCERVDWMRWVAGILIVVAAAHALQIQRYFFDCGRVQHNLKITLESYVRSELARHPGAPLERPIVIEIEPGGPEPVVRRFLHELYKLDGTPLPPIYVSKDGDAPPEAAHLRVTDDGTLFPL